MKACYAGQLLGPCLLFLPLACRMPERPARLEFLRARTHQPRTRSFDVLHQALDLSLDPEGRRIEGECRIRLTPLFEPVEEVELDLVGLEVRSVQDERGGELVFEHDGRRLRIELSGRLEREQESELVVRYGGRPVTGLWFSGQRLDGSGPTQVFSHGQAQHSSGWFPCFDDPAERATSELCVQLPPGWVSVAAGERIECPEGGEERREHWRMSFAHPPYLTTLVAGEFVVREERWQGIPLLYLVEPQYEDWLEPTFRETDEILTFFSDLTGVRYPYPKYSQAAVANFPWGGMENISATTLTPRILADERGLRDEPPAGLIAHEAAHQWFGDLLTCADWSQLWLNEGLATYLMLLYVEHSKGQDEFRAQLREAQESYLALDVGRARRPTVWNVWKEPEDLFDVRAYQGAAVRLHLLRFVLGDEAFRTGLQGYAAENAGRSVVTADLQRAFERASGRDLDVFFRQWFHLPGYPEFELGWEWDEGEGELVLEVEQVQETDDGTPGAFRVPVEVELRDETGTSAFRLEIDERHEEFELASPRRPLYVRFDKHGWIPKRVRSEPELAELLAIARLDDDLNGRRDAVRMLGQRLEEAGERRARESGELVLELTRRLLEDRSAAVRAEAARALGRAASARASVVRAPLEGAAERDPEARVRVAALGALRAFAPDAALAELAERAFEHGFSWNTMGAAAGLFCAAAPEQACDWVRERLLVDSPHDRLAALLLDELARLADPRVPAELERWALDESLDPAARAVAVAALAQRAPGTDTSALLVPLLEEEEAFVLRLAAVQALARLGDERACTTLRAYYPRARSPDERRAIEALLDRVAP